MIRGARSSYIMMLGALLACARVSDGSARKADLRALEGAAERDSVAAAAVRVASSGDPAALKRLGEFLAAPGFLARLDDTTSPQLATSNLNRVFSALATHPSKATESLCLRVMSTASFQPPSERLFFALPTLAAFRPMSAASVALFSNANAGGFYSLNGPLLAGNGSPRAMSLLQVMFADQSHSIPDRIAMSREALVPHRTSLATVRLVDSLMLRPDLEPELAISLAQCLFDYRPEEWYGKRRNPPAAPDWKRAPGAARREAARLGKRLLSAHADWPETLREAIRAVTGLKVRASPRPSESR